MVPDKRASALIERRPCFEVANALPPSYESNRPRRLPSDAGVCRGLVGVGIKSDGVMGRRGTREDGILRDRGGVGEEGRLADNGAAANLKKKCNNIGEKSK